MTIDTSLAGIQAGIARMNVSAVNIANLRSSGYRAYRVVQTESAPGEGPAVDVQRTDAPPELATEAVELLIAKRDIEANLAVLHRQDELLGTIVDVLA